MRLRSCFPDRERLLDSRWIRPFAHRLRDPRFGTSTAKVPHGGSLSGCSSLCSVRSDRRGSLLFLAISVRGHLITAAGATLVTNPLTFPLIYYAALRWGETILSAANLTAPAAENPMGAALGLAAPIAVALTSFAIACGAAAYWGVKLFWRVWTIRRWRNRARRPIGVKPV